MNDSKNSSKGLLVLRYPAALTTDQVEYLYGSLLPVVEALGLEALVVGDGADVRAEVDYTPLLSRLCAAVERLAAQGEPPAVSDEIVAPALNQRPSGLNTRPKETNGRPLPDPSTLPQW